MPVSAERRAALRRAFDGGEPGIKHVEVGDILGVLDDLDAADKLAAQLQSDVGILRTALHHAANECSNAECDWDEGHEGAINEGLVLPPRVSDLPLAASPDSSPSTGRPKTEGPAALLSDGRGDAVCAHCGAVVECRHHERLLSAHRPDCPLAEAR